MAYILVTEKISDKGLEILRQGEEVRVEITPSGDRLVTLMREAVALLVRSQVKVTAEAIEAAPYLKIIGRCGAGVDNIDLAAATKRGILVVNSPEGNTIAAAEHTIAVMLALLRRIPAADASLRRGEWARSRFIGTEIAGKVLGIIGLGRIGSEVARRAQGLGLRPIASDPLVTPERARSVGVELLPLEAVLEQADVITLHLPLTRQTHHLLGAAQLALMKPTAYLINCARGGIVDEAALEEALRSGRLAGAAIDVWEKEPPGPHPLLQLENVVATPHLAASTHEAQENVAVDVARQVVAALQGRPVTSAVNIPALTPEAYAQMEPYLTLADKLGSFLAQLADGRLQRVELSYSGGPLPENAELLTRTFIRSLLSPSLGQYTINFVNALLIAEERGITVVQRPRSKGGDYTHLIAAKVVTDGGTHSAAGTIFGQRDLRIVLLDGYRVNIVPEGLILVFSNVDKPGVIGRVGTILGNAQVNIAGMQVGRQTPGGEAVTVINVDQPVPPKVQQEIAQAEGLVWLKLADFGES